MVKEGYTRELAVSYYLFRLRRMYEMAYQTPDGIFLTYEDMLKDEGRKLVSDYLGIKSIPPVTPAEDRSESWIPDRGYTKYLTMFRSLPLHKV